MGLNAVREIIARMPLLCEPDACGDLMADLVLYRKYKDKGVALAGRALLNVVRAVAPGTLRSKDRGRVKG